MKMCQKNDKWLIAAILFIFITSVSMLGIPVSSELRIQGIMWCTYLVGGIFWGSLVCGYFCVILYFKRQKKAIQNGKEKRIGFFRFFSNMPGRIFDIFAIGSGILFLSLYSFKPASQSIYFIFLGILFFSVHMHSIFNSRYYTSITWKKFYKRKERE